MSAKTKTGLLLAAAAAALLSAGCMHSHCPTAPMMHKGSVKCMGINSCKGTSECATAKSVCKGHNSCKGSGWVTVGSVQDCLAQGGKPVEGK